MTSLFFRKIYLIVHENVFETVPTIVAEAIKALIEIIFSDE